MESKTENGFLIVMKSHLYGQSWGSGSKPGTYRRKSVHDRIVVHKLLTIPLTYPWTADASRATRMHCNQKWWKTKLKARYQDTHCFPMIAQYETRQRRRAADQLTLGTKIREWAEPCSASACTIASVSKVEALPSGSTEADTTTLWLPGAPNSVPSANRLISTLSSTRGGGGGEFSCLRAGMEPSVHRGGCRRVPNHVSMDSSFLRLQLLACFIRLRD